MMWAEIPWNISDLKVYKAKRLTTNTEFDFLFFIYADNKKKMVNFYCITWAAISVPKSFRNWNVQLQSSTEQNKKL